MKVQLSLSCSGRVTGEITERLPDVLASLCANSYDVLKELLGDQPYVLACSMYSIAMKEMTYIKVQLSLSFWENYWGITEKLPDVLASLCANSYDVLRSYWENYLKQAVCWLDYVPIAMMFWVNLGYLMLILCIYAQAKTHALTMCMCVTDPFSRMGLMCALCYAGSGGKKTMCAPFTHVMDPFT